MGSHLGLLRRMVHRADDGAVFDSDGRLVCPQAGVGIMVSTAQQAREGRGFATESRRDFVADRSGA